MISALDEMNDFMGMKLPDSFKAQLKKEITTGQFTQKNNNARTQVKARLYDLVGDKIMSQFQQSLETERELAFNRGLEKGQGTLYNKPPKTNSPGHVKPTDDNYKDEKAGFRGIDADAIDTSR
jgi:predicted metalloprotease with PDZ domain